MAIKKKEEARARGRPTDYTEEVAEEICEHIAEGKSLNSWINEDSKNRPNRSTIYRWLDKSEDFRNKYIRAKDMSADYHAENILDVAERNDLNPNDKRVRIDAMKWVASKLKPKSYGDRVAHEHTDGEGNSLTPIINVTIGTEPKPAS
ncbi:MAG: hypothetical protein JJ964_05760 [Rhizobiales bacterium]|nr:hypothetical protein [Hyphomicrobiales bacterium]